MGYLLDNRYGTDGAYGNNCEWQIGTPLRLNDVCVLMRAELGVPLVGQAMTAIRRYAPDPLIYGSSAATGANLAWTCIIGALRGANEESDTPLDIVRTGINPVFPYVSDRDGFYPRRLVHPARDPRLHRRLRELAAQGADQLPRPAQGLRVVSHVWGAGQHPPVGHRGLRAPDPPRRDAGHGPGREVSRSVTSGGWAARTVTASVLRLAGNIATGAQATDFMRLAKHWITTGSLDCARPVQIAPGLLAYARSVVDDAAITPRTPAAGARVFAGMDRASLVRPGFTLGVAMASTRTGTHELINDENQRGWYQAAGTTYLQTNGDQDQHLDAYWPTANPYRMPGTTVDTRARVYENAKFINGVRDWAGGARGAGRFAAIGHNFADEGSSLTARKSWFLIDDVIVCVGSGITASHGQRIETVVDSRNLYAAGTGAFIVDGAAQPTTTAGPAPATSPGPTLPAPVATCSPAPPA